MYEHNMESLPSRERGLKSKDGYITEEKVNVAPFAGAWIEIMINAPDINVEASLPSRERGLKSQYTHTWSYVKI